MAKKATGERWSVTQGQARLTSMMSPEEIRAAIAEQRRMVNEALGGLPVPASLERTWRRLVQHNTTEQPNE